MPRSRRRHHSRSRSRSRSHSHERDREPKRRKIENVDSPALKRSVSSDERSSEDERQQQDQQDVKMIETVELATTNFNTPTKKDDDNTKPTNNTPSSAVPSTAVAAAKALTPKQLQKKLESEKKREEKQREKEERERKRQEEKRKKQEEREKIEMERLKQKEMKDEQKRKEREEKDAKKREKEEREEQKRKEREMEKMKKQQQIEEKNKEKQKEEEKKQKTVKAFVSFFVPNKKSGDPTSAQVLSGGGGESVNEKKMNFMPFQMKSDMKLPPERRAPLSQEEKENLVECLEKQLGDNSDLYLKELKNGLKSIGKCEKTWPNNDDVVLIQDEEVGDSIYDDDKVKSKKMRAKFLKFHENRRPAYFGTWTKKSRKVTARKPFAEDVNYFDYEVDSDDDWEEEDQNGESLNGSEDEDKENDVDNVEDDYEVDNEFFVPHGHLSDDEMDEEPLTKLSPESQKQKLKLLKDEFDKDMKTKTEKIKPRSIGCIWYNKDGSNVDEMIDRHLKPLAMITNGRILIAKRCLQPVKDGGNKRKKEKSFKCKFSDNVLVELLKIIQRSKTSLLKEIVNDFLASIKEQKMDVQDGIKTNYVKGCIMRFAEKKDNDFWVLKEDVKNKFNIE